MSKTAILVDGGFYRKRSKFLWGLHPPEETAIGLVTYCYRHLSEHDRKHDLYRIFYYDCPPITKQMYHPLDKKDRDMARSDDSIWMSSFLECLKEKRKFALRLGHLDNENTYFTLKYRAVKQLCAESRGIKELTDSDFEPAFRQKGVDMKIGMDIASLAYKKQVDQIVLIAGDSDFVPAAKLARREGLDFILDPLEMSIKDDLLEHIDGKRSCGNPYKTKKEAIAANKTQQ